MSDVQNNNSKPGNVMSIIGLVLAIIALVFSFVPCLGMYAIFPGVVALILGIVGFMQAKKVGISNTMAIAAIVLAVASCGLAAYQYTLAQKTSDKFKEIGKDFEKGAKEFTDSLNLKLDTIILNKK